MPPVATPDPAVQQMTQEVQQMLSFLRGPLTRIAPLLKPVYRRMPYSFPLSQTATIGAGLNNQALVAADFQNSLEWDFECHEVAFSQDISHTTRDWRFLVQDNLVSQTLMKSSAMVSTLIDKNTGKWELPFPWIVPKKGGGLQPFVDNLDTANPINVDVNFIGFLLIPVRA